MGQIGTQIKEVFIPEPMKAPQIVPVKEPVREREPVLVPSR
jgi:hypothetical protein